jgi:uncharacterized protein YabN with tetrapyrrole methylase and pyrophosphatase domain
MEFGDLLFSLVNVGRLAGLNSEDCLRLTNRKFKHRFQYIEEVLGSTGQKTEGRHVGRDGRHLGRGQGKHTESGDTS